MKSKVSLLGVMILMCVTFGLNACGNAPAPRIPPPPEVTENAPVLKEVTQYLEYTGTTAAVESVEIRGRVGGYLQEIHFKPRAKVKAGDTLFVIDPRPYETKVKLSQAALDSKRAALRIREIELDKYLNLATKEVIPGLKLDDVKATRDMAKAEVEQAAANLDSAKLDLAYAHVKSPIDGRISRHLVDIGNLISPTDNSLLANVVQDDSIYVYFNLSEIDLLKLTRKANRNKENPTPGELDTSAYMALADETGYPRTGVLDYTDIKVDPSTGTIQMRAIFKNPKGILYPGMFARVRIPLETQEAMLVPDVAVLNDQGGKYVLVVKADNVVEIRRIQAGALLNDMRIIESGLKVSDRVIVSGTQKARPGSKVTPVTAMANSSSPTPAGSTRKSKN